MYSKKIIAARIADYEKKTARKLVYHSLEQVIERNARFKSYEYTDDKGNTFAGLEKYTPEDHEWIENEFTLCAFDFEYWATRYAFIDVQGVLKRFTFRKSQRILLKLWARREELGYGIEQIILKARQQGISTLVELALTHRTIFKRNRKVVVSSAVDEQSVLMNQMMQTCLNELPFWMKPDLVTAQAGKKYAWNTGSRLTIYSGRGVTGIGRGDSPTDTHISEACDIPNAKALIEDGLFKAVHPSPEIFMILESTGNGNVGWWADTWYFSRDNWAAKRARLEPVFFPWFLADDLFPTLTWRDEHPVPRNWKPMPETLKMAAKCEAYVSNTPLMLEELGRDWKLPRHQAYWWELSLLEARSKQNEKGFRQEMPCDDIEALQSKKNLVFSAESIESSLQNRTRTYTAWAITGEQILDKHHPHSSTIDYEAERFRVQRNSQIRTIRGWEPKTLVWEFIPLHADEDGLKLFDADRKLLVFHPPEPDYDYTIGVDTARALGEDATSITVMRRARDGSEPDIQAAEFTSKFVDSAEAHAFVLAIATWYSWYMPKGREPLVGVEQLLGPGDNVQLQMKVHGYRRFFKFARLDGADPIKAQKNATREGWFTNAWSRPFMLDRFKSAFENGWLILHSPFLIQNEMSCWVVDTANNRARYDHESGKHDDRIFSMAIAFIIANSTEAMSERITTRFVPEPEKMPEVDFTIPTSFGVSYSQVALGRGGFFNT